MYSINITIKENFQLIFHVLRMFCPCLKFEVFSYHITEVSRSALLKEDLIGCIFETMQKQEFLSDVTVQSSACKALRLLLDHGEI